MRTYLVRLGLAIFFLSFLYIIISCSGAKTEIIGEWQEESYQKGNIDKVLILVIFNKDKSKLCEGESTLVFTDAKSRKPIRPPRIFIELASMK